MQSFYSHTKQVSFQLCVIADRTQNDEAMYMRILHLLCLSFSLNKSEDPIVFMRSVKPGFLSSAAKHWFAYIEACVHQTLNTISGWQTCREGYKYFILLQMKHLVDSLTQASSFLKRTKANALRIGHNPATETVFKRACGGYSIRNPGSYDSVYNCPGKPYCHMLDMELENLVKQTRGTSICSMFLHHQYKLRICKLEYAWYFRGHQLLAVNTTFHQIQFAEKRNTCQYGNLSVSEMFVEKTLPHRDYYLFCGSRSGFAIYSKTNVQSLNLVADLRVYYKLHFSFIFVDTNLVKTNTMAEGDTNEYLIFNSLYIAWEGTMLCFSIKAEPHNQVVLYKNLHFLILYAFDGPGDKMSRFVFLRHQQLQTTSFQCTVYALAHTVLCLKMFNIHLFMQLKTMTQFLTSTCWMFQLQRP